MKFELTNTDSNSNARAGIINTVHGNIQTPTFMPVGTAGTVKAIHQKELSEAIKAKIILGNTYHLYLRPGLNILGQVGGLHKFMGWEHPILTDSGGYQVYSLAKNKNITEEGVTFKSHIDGTKHFFSPERAIDIQRSIGADIIMAFDECTPYPCEYSYAKKSMQITHKWLKRCFDRFNKSTGIYGYEQTLFPIVQGSTYQDLRKESAETIALFNGEGNAIGGLSVGEPKDDMYNTTELVCSILPKSKPRYLMGVGTPENILECISLGVDMFDCVMPTRNARNGMLFTTEGIINIRNKRWEDDFSPIDSNLANPAIENYSKAYLRHLVISKEILGAQIASIQNLAFYLWLINKAREHIIAGTFHSWKNSVIPKVSQRL